MPIIYTYPQVAPASGDLVIISDVSSTDPKNATKQCTIGDIVSLVGSLVPGGGTVTSISTTNNIGAGIGFAATPNPITGAGNIDLNYSGAIGDILYADTASSLAILPVDADGKVLTLAAGIPAWTSLPASGDVTDFTNSNGTFVSFSTINAAATGSVTVGTVDLSATGVPGASNFLCGNNTWATPPNTNTTYSLSAEAKAGSSVPVTLTDSSAGTSIVNLTEGTNITLTRNSSNEITIAATGLSGSSGTYTPTLVTQGAGGVGIPSLVNVDYLAQSGKYYVKDDHYYIDFYLVFYSSGGIETVQAVGDSLGIGVDDGGIEPFSHIVPLVDIDSTVTNNATVNISVAECYTNAGLTVIESANWVMMPQSGSMGKYTNASASNRPFAWLCGHTYAASTPDFPTQTNYSPTTWINLTVGEEQPESYGVLAGSINGTIGTLV